MRQVKSGDEFEFPLQVRLAFDDKSHSPVEKDVLEVDPSTPRLGRNGKTSFRVRLKDVSMNFDNRDLCLQISAPGAKANKYYIAPVISDPMTVIRHRLRIRSETQPPTVWYKDEGGRDKCIEVMVDLVDSEGRRVHGQEVPLKVSLLYEDLQAVGKQDILKLSSDSRQAIDHTGTATLRLRIDDVSKNHQSKGFVIQVAPDVQHSPLNSDISPDTSTSVSVRSKRNRRSKHGRSGAGAGGSGSQGLGSMDEDMSLVGHTLSRSSVDLTMPVVSHAILHETAQLAMLPGSNGDMGGGGGGGGSGRVGSHPLLSGGPVGAAAGGGAGGTPIIKALSNVISWTRTVVNGLYQIQWQLIGYESKPDGSPDINKPLFNIHNPNAIVTNILQNYRAETMEHLRYLVQALEPNAAAAAAAAGGGGNLKTDGGEGDEPPPLATPFGGGGYSTASSYGGGGGGEPGGGAGGGGGGASHHPPHAAQQLHRPPLPPPTTSGGPLLPPMIRGRSGLAGAMGEGGGGGGGEFANVGLVPLVRESTYDLLAGMDPSWFGMDSTEPSPNAALEAQVQTVVAKEYFSDTYDTLGFPAFDHKQVLLGFYKEGRNDQGQTVAYFIPLPPNFSDTERRGVSDLLRVEGDKGNGAVVHLVNDDLNQLKERVLTYHWSRNADGGSRGAGSGGGSSTASGSSSSSSSTGGGGGAGGSGSNGTENTTKSER